MSIGITHTAAEGTLVHGTARGDGTNTILKTAGFRWFCTVGAWGIPSSRDRQPNLGKIERAAAALRAAGHPVSVDIDSTHRCVADAEADRAQRQDDRADALAAKADRRAAAAETAWEAEARASAAVPPGGEPIKIGHHSERRHRKSIERAQETLGRAVQATDAATEAARRAKVAAAGTAHRHSPVTVKNASTSWRLNSAPTNALATATAASWRGPRPRPTSTSSAPQPAPTASRSWPAWHSAPTRSPTGRTSTPPSRPPA